MAGMTTHATEAPRNWVPVDTFAIRLLAVRAQQGLKQEEAADRCQLKRASWALWEAGSLPRDVVSVVTKIADGLGVDRDWLLFGGPMRSGAESGLRPRQGSNLRPSDYKSTLRPPRHLMLVESLTSDDRPKRRTYAQASAA